MSGDTSQKSFLTQGDSGKAITEIEDLRESIMKINDRENFKKFSIFLKPSSISLPVSPLYVDTEPLFEFPEPYSRFPLAIYFKYGNVSF